MANSIQVAQIFENLVDEGYRAKSRTARLFEQGLITPVGEGYGKFQVMKVSTDGIGTYDKNLGYPESGKIMRRRRFSQAGRRNFTAI